MRLDYHPERMLAYGITVSDIQSALNRENIELPGGKVYGNNTELIVKTMGRLNNEDDFKNLILREDETGSIRLSDVADVRLGSESEEVGFRLNGINSSSMMVNNKPK